MKTTTTPMPSSPEDTYWFLLLLLVVIPLTVVFAAIIWKRKYLASSLCKRRKRENSQHADYRKIYSASSTVKEILLIIRSGDVDDSLFYKTTSVFQANYHVVSLEENQPDILQNINDWVDNKLKDNTANICAIIILEKSNTPSTTLLRNVCNRVDCNIPKFRVKLCENNESRLDGMHGARIFDCNIADITTDLAKLHRCVQVAINQM